MNTKVDVKRLKEDEVYFNSIVYLLILDCNSCVFNSTIISKEILKITGDSKKGEFAESLIPRVDVLIETWMSQGIIQEFLGAYINRS